MVTAPADRARLGRRAQLLAAASVSYNLVEAVVAISAGLVAGSKYLLFGSNWLGSGYASVTTSAMPTMPGTAQLEW